MGDSETCSFFAKLGTCRHGDRCSRAHLRPTSTPVVLLHHIWVMEPGAAKLSADAEAAEYEDFVKDVLQVRCVDGAAASSVSPSLSLSPSFVAVLARG